MMYCYIPPILYIRTVSAPTDVDSTDNTSFIGLYTAPFGDTKGEIEL